jgi:hypothetical protein
MAESRGWRRLIEPDMLVALSAMVVGACALMVSIVEVRIMREEQRANAWPRVEAFVNTGDTYVMRLTNKGFGPAMIRGLVVTVDGEPVRDWGQLSQLVLGDTVNYTQAKITDTVLAPQDQLEIFKPTAADGVPVRISQAGGRIGLELCYCSVYEDCWWLRRPSFATGGRWTHEEVKECRIPEERRFMM